MAGALPSNPQPHQGQAHTLPRDPQALLRLQIMPQERSCPHGRPIPQLAGVLVNDAINERINNLPGGPGPSTPWAIAESAWDGQCPALVKARPPVKNRPATHPQSLSHLSGALPSLTPQQGLGTTQGFCVLRVGRNLF